MNSFLCAISGPLEIVVNIYILILIVYAIASWIPDLRGRWLDYVAMLVEPVITPIRRVIPPIGGVDLAFLVLILVLGFVRSGLSNSCYISG